MLFTDIEPEMSTACSFGQDLVDDGKGGMKRTLWQTLDALRRRCHLRTFQKKDVSETPEQSFYEKTKRSIKILECFQSQDLLLDRSSSELVY